MTSRGQRVRVGPSAAATTRPAPTMSTQVSRRRSPGTVARATSTTTGVAPSRSASQPRPARTSSIGCATSTIVSMGCSALGGAGIASACGRGVPARSSRTWSRDPCTQPSEIAPSSAVLAAANPVADAEAHSTTRAEPSVALAKATANTVAPHDPAQPTTGNTRSPAGGFHTIRACVVSGRGGRRRVLSDTPVARNSPAWTACQARRSSSTPTGLGTN